MSRPIVSYTADTRLKAEREQRAMITIDVNTKYVKNPRARGRITLQTIADSKMEKRVARVLLDALKGASHGA
jgi:hypothetical protein